MFSVGNRASESQVFHYASSNKVVNEDAFDVFGSTILVPNTLRIDDRNGTREADPKTLHFAALDPALLGEAELFEPCFKVIPSCSGYFAFAARLLRATHTHENMPACLLKTESFSDGLERF